MKKELCVYRREIKYIIPLSEVYDIKNKLDCALNKDSHYDDKPYKVRSLYFDSLGNRDFHDKLAGVENRRKFRLRIYGQDESVCKLEKKEKMGILQSKKSLFLNRDDAELCSKGEFEVLKKYFSESPFAVSAYSELTMNCYKPACLVEYDRCAYIHPLYDTRVTLDMNIRSEEVNLGLFSNIKGISVENKIAILEYKYSGEPVDYISQLLSSFGLEQSSYSKYCNGRSLYYSLN